MNVIKKIFEKDIDEKTHNQFTRFGKGEYPGRFLLGLWKAKKIKIKSGFEFANDLVSLCALFGECKSSGIILSKKDISKILKEKGIIGSCEEKRGGLYFQNNISQQNLNKEKLNALIENSYFALLDLDGDEFKLRIKKKLPKPGKDEGKIDDKFCQLEAEEKFYKTLKDDLFWDVPESKKISIKHNIQIKEIIMPAGEKDYAKIREFAKRKGKIIRVINYDGKEIEKEIEIEA